jgi:hypothetical protein
MRFVLGHAVGHDALANEDRADDIGHWDSSAVMQLVFEAIQVHRT